MSKISLKYLSKMQHSIMSNSKMADSMLSSLRNWPWPSAGWLFCWKNWSWLHSFCLQYRPIDGILELQNLSANRLSTHIVAQTLCGMNSWKQSATQSQISCIVSHRIRWQDIARYSIEMLSWLKQAKRLRSHEGRSDSLYALWLIGIIINRHNLEWH